MLKRIIIFIAIMLFCSVEAYMIKETFFKTVKRNHKQEQYNDSIAEECRVVSAKLKVLKSYILLKEYDGYNIVRFKSKKHAQK